MKYPLSELHKYCSLMPGIPVEPMLAKPTKSVGEVLKRLEGQRFTLEYKYDGERVQVHQTEAGAVKCFSRNLLDTSDKFPEVPGFVREACVDSGVTSFVLDAEVVAYDSEKDMLVPFQILSTRKKEVKEGEESKVKVIVQAFDIMYLNGESLLSMSLSDRRDLLQKNFMPVQNKFRFAVGMDASDDGDTSMIETFLDNAIKGQCEGLMVKTLDANSAYEPSKVSPAHTTPRTHTATPSNPDPNPLAVAELAQAEEGLLGGHGRLGGRGADRRLLRQGQENGELRRVPRRSLQRGGRRVPVGVQDRDGVQRRDAEVPS